MAEERFAVGHWSRFPEERIVLAGSKTDPEGYVERLSQVLRRGKYDLLVPGTERSLLPISEHRRLIEPYACLGLPSHEAVLRALNKPLLQDQAAAVGLAPPTSVICSKDEETLMIARELGFPLVVKPVRSVTWTTGRIRQPKAQIVGDENLLQAAVAEVGVPVTLQKCVSRPTIVSCAGVRVDGRLLGLTFVRYARTFPPQVGSAALAVTIAPPQPLLQQVEELLERIGWCGIFELELLELGENRFGAIDFNPRPFGWMALAIEAGANLPALWCDYALQRREISSQGARVGTHYRWEDGDICYALAQLRSGHLRSAAAVLRPRRGAVHGYFRLDDPAPLVARLLSVAQKATRRIRGLVTPIRRMFALN